MNVVEILMRGFMSHIDTTLKLPTAGLVLVTGPNGGGKSSLVEGVSYGGWGESLRGTPPWSEGPGHLELTSALAHIERAYSGAREKLTWNLPGMPPTKWESNTKAEKALGDVLGSHDVWRRTHVFSSHDAANFTMSTDGDRKRLLESFLGLHRFDEALERCRVELHKIEREEGASRARVQQMLASVIAARDRVADAEKVLAVAPAEVDAQVLKKKAADLFQLVAGAAEDFREAAETKQNQERQRAAILSSVAEVNGRVVSLEGEKRDLLGRLTKRADLEKEAAAHEDLKAQLVALEAEMADVRCRRDAYQATVNTWREKHGAAALSLKQATLALSVAETSAAGLSNVPCGGEGQFASCRLIIGATGARAQILGLKKLLEAAQADVAAVGNAPVEVTPDIAPLEARRREMAGQVAVGGRAATALGALGEVQARVAAIDVDLHDGRLMAVAKEAEASAISKSITMQTAIMEGLQEEHEALRRRHAEVDANLRQVEAAVVQRRVAQEGVDRARTALSTIESALAKEEAVEADAARRLRVHGAVEQVLGLKGIRAHVLGRALGGIEQAANSWLQRFGLNMSLELRPYTEKKTGGVSDAISLSVKGAGGGHGYRASSGGERRRIDIALLFALAEVASAAQGRPPGTTFADECFDALDAEGVEKVVDVLKDLSKDRTVVVITHNEDLVAALTPDLHLHVDRGTVTVV